MRPGSFLGQNAAMDVRAVVFDLDGTLYDLAAARRRLFAQAPRQALRHGPRRFLARVRIFQAFRRARERHRGSPPVESLVDTLVERVAAELGATSREVRRVVDDYLFDSEFHELRGLSPAEDREALWELHRRGYALGVLSEYPIPRKLGALGLADLPWRAQVCCEELGVLKPDPRPFLEAARRLGTEPPQVLLVGDRRDADVAGARAAGMPAAWLARGPDAGTDDPSPLVRIERLPELLGHLPALEG